MYMYMYMYMSNQVTSELNKPPPPLFPWPFLQSGRGVMLNRFRFLQTAPLKNIRDGNNRFESYRLFSQSNQNTEVEQILREAF